MPRLPDLIDQFARIRSGDPWYGPSIAQVLDGVTARQAASRPIPQAHSIWEIVLHLTAWVNEVRRRLETGVWRLPEVGDWPEVTATTGKAWQEAIDGLLKAHDQLIRLLQALEETRLDETLGQERDAPLGTGVSYSVTLHGLLQHDAYHLGQVTLLKKRLTGRKKKEE
jgi:uncharacterized damage-inducible protein DinB